MGDGIRDVSLALVVHGCYAEIRQLGVESSLPFATSAWWSERRTDIQILSAIFPILLFLGHLDGRLTLCIETERLHLVVGARGASLG